VSYYVYHQKVKESCLFLALRADFVKGLVEVRDYEGTKKIISTLQLHEVALSKARDPRQIITVHPKGAAPYVAEILDVNPQKVTYYIRKIGYGEPAVWIDQDLAGAFREEK